MGDERLGLLQRLAGRLDQVGEVEGHFALDDIAVGQRLAVVVRAGREQDILGRDAEAVLLDGRGDVLADLQVVVDFDHDFDAIEERWSGILGLVLARDEPDLLDASGMRAGELHLAVGG